MPTNLKNLALVAIGTFLVIYAQVLGGVYLLFVCMLVPFLILSFTHTHLLSAGAILFFLSYFTLPGVPVDLMLFQIMMAMFVIVTIAGQMITNRKVDSPPGLCWCLLLVFLLVILMLVRGMGFRVLGDGKIGGAPYLHVLISVGFFLWSARIRFSPDRWKLLLAGLGLFTIVPAVGHALVVLSGGRFYYPLYFIKPTYALQVTLLESERDPGMMRWAILGNLRALALVPAFLLPFRARNRLLFFTAWLISLMFAAFSGTRLWLLHTLVFGILFMVTFVQRKLATVLLMAAVALCVTALAIPLADKLPHGAQRILSHVPGVQVSHMAQADALYSLRWRSLLWKFAWTDLPRHLWVGKGFAFEAVNVNNGSMVLTPYDKVVNALVTGDLHLGPLSIIYVLGIPGMLLVVALTWSNVTWNLRRQRTRWHHPTLQRLHLVMLVYMASNIFLYLISGSARYIIPELFFQFALLHAIACSDHMPESDGPGLEDSCESVS